MVSCGGNPLTNVQFRCFDNPGSPLRKAIENGQDELDGYNCGLFGKQDEDEYAWKVDIRVEEKAEAPTKARNGALTRIKQHPRGYIAMVSLNSTAHRQIDSSFTIVGGVTRQLGSLRKWTVVNTSGERMFDRIADIPYGIQMLSLLQK